MATVRTASLQSPLFAAVETGRDSTGTDGVPGLLFHDRRGSAIRNMLRRGVTERVAMRISGHKSRSVFERYDIVSESALADAALKVERAGKDELARADSIQSSYIEPGKSEADSREENARKPS